MAAATLVAGLLAGACQRTAPAEANEPAAAAPKRVRCEPLVARDIGDTVELHGTVAPLPDRDAEVAAQVVGRIERVLVREGDAVKRGQPLARIDAAALTDEARQAAARLAKARAESHVAELSRARTERVFERGIAARQELDDAAAREAAAASTEAEAKAAAEIADRQLQRATLRSPLAGVVLKVFRKSGELVDGTPATPVVEVGDPSELELVATATAAELVRSRRGAAATIELPALPGVAITGAVAAISPAVDRATGMGVVRVSLRAPADARPPVGVAGVARIAAGTPRHAIAAPAAALRAATGSDAEIVVCGADRRAHVVRVERGTTAGAMVEIRPRRSGAAAALAAGTEVAVEPVLGIADGDALEPAR